MSQTFKYNIVVERRNELVSVILPWHRADRLLDGAIESVKSSLNIRIQLILVDDRAEPLEDQWGSQSHLRTYGGGYENALNSAKEFIEGDFTSLMNSDDLISPFRFRNQIDALYRDQARLSITRVIKMTARGKVKSTNNRNLRNGSLPRESLLFSSDLANSTWLADSLYWHENVNFERHGNGSDWLLAAKLSRDIENWSYLNEELYFYRQHPKQITSNRHPINPSIVQEWSNLNIELGLPKLDGNVGARLIFLKAKASTLSIDEIGMEQLLIWSTELIRRNPGLARELNRRLSIFFIRNLKISHLHDRRVQHILFSFLTKSMKDWLLKKRWQY